MKRDLCYNEGYTKIHRKEGQAHDLCAAARGRTARSTLRHARQADRGRDGDAALLYLYILRHGGTDGSAAARALRLSADRYERAAFTLNNLIAPNGKTKAATDKSAEAPRYTGDELRRARLDDQTFSGLCDAAEALQAVR